MSLKIALIVGTNLHWAPFYYRYERMLDEKRVPFDLIIWNRENIKETNRANKVIEYKNKDIPNNKNPKKAYKFLLFSHFVKTVIKKNNYDKLIFVGTYGCAIAFDCFFLSKYYQDKMWIDVRDDLYEWFSPFFKAEERSINASYATTISSPAFKRFLPEHNYYLMHNIDPNYLDLMKQYRKITDSEGRIRISFIGNVRYLDQNKILLKNLKNDKRFKVQYYGHNSEIVEDYCKQNGINNVEFYGNFPQSETINFYEKTDIINNAYGNDTLNLQVALSNKLYYGLMFHLPLLVSNNTLMDNLTSKYGIGFVL